MPSSLVIDYRYCQNTYVQVHSRHRWYNLIIHTRRIICCFPHHITVVRGSVMWGQGVYGAQILVWVHKFTFKIVLGVIFSHRLLLLLNIQIEKSLIRVLFEYSNTIEWQYKKQVTNTKEWQFWPPIFKASATPDCSVLFMHSLFFPFCGKLGLESCINPRDYSDVTYMPVFGNMAISCYHDSPFSNSP